MRDGGIDLRMSREGRTYIVECKCYDRSHRAGRPVAQKLQGANAVERAGRMVVVTTSAFSQDAIDYAGQVGAELIDGVSSPCAAGPGATPCRRASSRVGRSRSQSTTC